MAIEIITLTRRVHFLLHYYVVLLSFVTFILLSQETRALQRENDGVKEARHDNKQKEVEEDYMEWLQGEAYKKTKNKSTKVHIRILEPVPEWIDDLDSPKKWVKTSVTTTQGPPVGPAIDPEDVGNIASV